MVVLPNVSADFKDQLGAIMGRFQGKRMLITGGTHSMGLLRAFTHLKATVQPLWFQFHAGN